MLGHGNRRRGPGSRDIPGSLPIINHKYPRAPSKPRKLRILSVIKIKVAGTKMVQLSVINTMNNNVLKILRNRLPKNLMTFRNKPNLISTKRKTKMQLWQLEPQILRPTPKYRPTSKIRQYPPGIKDPRIQGKPPKILQQLIGRQPNLTSKITTGQDRGYLAETLT